MSEAVDTLVIGGGMGGLPLALRAAGDGRTMLVEQKLLGGTCLNRGCIPTKTMIASARVAHLARRAAEFGVHAGAVAVDLGAVVDRKDGVIDAIRSGSYRTVRGRDGLELAESPARLVGPHTAEVDGRRIEAKRMVLAAGSRARIPAIDGLDTVAWLDSTSMLDLRQLPRHLVVVGGGYIGVEFAQMFRRFGSAVTVVQRSSRLLPGEDEEISAGVADVFAAEGIDVLLGAEVVSVEPGTDTIRIVCANNVTCDGTHLLLAAGRVPNSDHLDVDAAGLAVDALGFVQADVQLRTSVEDVYAFGDLTGPPMFTHSARDDADVLYRSVYRGEARTTEGRVVPHAAFCDIPRSGRSG